MFGGGEAPVSLSDKQPTLYLSGRLGFAFCIGETEGRDTGVIACFFKPDATTSV